MSTNTNTKMAEALQDGLSVCNSVSMAAGRRVVIDGCVLYAQTEEWCQWAKKEVRPRLQTALNAHDAEQAAQAVPAGFVLVPVAMTPEMRTALLDYAGPGYVDEECLPRVWSAILAAAPTPPAPEAPRCCEKASGPWKICRECAEASAAYSADMRRDAAPAPEAEATPAPAQQAAGQEQDERDAFEAWAISYSTIPLKRDDDASLGFTGYTEMDQTMLWDAWQARAALAQRRQPLTDEDWRTRDSSDTDEGCAALHRAHGIGATTGEQR